MAKPNANKRKGVFINKNKGKGPAKKARKSNISDITKNYEALADAYYSELNKKVPEHGYSRDDPGEGPSRQPAPVEDKRDEEDVDLEWDPSYDEDLLMAAADNVENQGVPMEGGNGGNPGGARMSNDQSGANGGGGGFGKATGNWIGGTSWGSGGFTTRRTWQTVIPVYNNHDYTESKTTTANNYKLVYKTPWRVLNFNGYFVHMNPADFQHLINTYARWRPKYMKVMMNNIQLKTKIANPVSINNNLTATMQVFEDRSRILPTSLDPFETGKPSPLMQDEYRPMGYDYFAESEWNGNPNSYTSLYLLEEMGSDMLRCEGHYATSHTFNCGWVDNMRVNVQMPFWYQPNLDQMWGLSGDTLPVGETARLLRRKIWRTGPYQYNVKASSAAATGQTINSITMLYAGPGTDSNAGEGHVLSTRCEEHESILVGNVNARVTNYNTNAAEGQRQPSTNATSATATFINGEGSLQANQVLEKPPVNWQGPIWLRKPNVDATTVDCNMFGALLMDDPPPAIYTKVTPQPTDTAGEFENCYATCTLSVEMGWETVPFHTKRFNPINLYSYSSADAAAGKFLVNAAGKMALNVPITAKQLFKHA